MPAVRRPKARRLRMTQCAEGWHRDDEPEHDATVDQPTDDASRAGRRGRATVDRRWTRRARSTRRRADAPDLPRLPVEARTVGRTFTAPDGRDLPAVDVRHPDPALLRQGHPRPRRPGRPGPVRLPPRRAGRPALLQARRPVGAEPAPLRRVQGAVLRRRRTPAPPRPAPARRDPRRDPPRHHPGRHPRPPTTSCGGHPSTTTTSSTPTGSRSGTASRCYRDPDTGRPLPTWGQALDDLDDDPGREAGARHAVRAAGRHQGPDRRHAGLRPRRAVPDQVPDQGRRRDLRRPDGRARRPRVRGAHRPAARGGALAAVLAGVRELAAVRHPAEGRRPRPDAPAGARPRRTTANTSASAAAASWSPAAGPARPSPSTGPTAPPSSAGPRGRRHRAPRPRTGWRRRRSTRTGNLASSGTTCRSAPPTTRGSSWPP